MVPYDQIFEHIAVGEKPSGGTIRSILCGWRRTSGPTTVHRLLGQPRSGRRHHGSGTGRCLRPSQCGHIVANTDLNTATAIEYAVVVLEVKHVIVCGHYNCGGVKAAMRPRDMGILNPWLRNIRDVYRLHKDELNAISEEGARYDRLVELSVIEQCINVVKTAAVQHSYLKRGYPLVHGLVFDLRTGIIKDLGINFEDHLRAIQEIYNLTDAPWPIGDR